LVSILKAAQEGVPMTDEHKPFKGKLAKKRKFGSDTKHGKLTEDDREFISESYDGEQSLRAQLARMMLESEMISRSGRQEQDLAMLPDLFKHFDIDTSDPDKFLHLSIKLAGLIVPGFQYEQGPRGRNVRWNDKTHTELLINVEDLRNLHPHWKLTDICEHISAQGTFGRISNKSLYNRYRKAIEAIPDFPIKRKST
jgi:hypothetical protein